MVIQAPFIPSIGAHLRSMIQLPVSASDEPFHGNYGSRDLETLKLGLGRELFRWESVEAESFMH